MHHKLRTSDFIVQVMQFLHEVLKRAKLIHLLCLPHLCARAVERIRAATGGGLVISRTRVARTSVCVRVVFPVHTFHFRHEEGTVSVEIAFNRMGVEMRRLSRSSIGGVSFKSRLGSSVRKSAPVYCGF